MYVRASVPGYWVEGNGITAAANGDITQDANLTLDRGVPNTGMQGNGAPHPNMPPYQAGIWVIKAL